MAYKVGTGYSLGAGGTHLWQWNNYVHDQVYSFAAKPLSAGLAGGEKQVRIGTVRYVVTPQFDAPSTTKILIEVVNTGTSSVNYDFYLTSV